MIKFYVKRVTTRKQYLEWSFRQTFKIEKQFRDGAIAIKVEKRRTNFDKTIYIGTSTLDLNKVLMQDFIIIILKINMVVKLVCC